MLDRLISWIPKPKRSAGSAPSEYAEAARVACSGLFDEDYYLAQTRKAGVPVEVYPQMHYVVSGYQQFDPHSNFNAASYRDKHGLAADVNPLLHWLDQRGGVPSQEKSELPPVVLAPRSRQFCFEHGRYLYALAVAFHDTGCSLYLETDSDAIQQRDRFDFFAILANEPWVTLLRPDEPAPEGAICLTDCPRRAAKGSSILWRRERPPKQDRAHLCPFPMHARQYQHGYHRHLSWLRSRQRTTPIYFAGACNWTYRVPYFEPKFRMPGRARLLRDLHTRFADRMEVDIRRNYRLRDRQPEDAPLFIADQREQRSPAVLWLEQLAYADCFLALPGAYVPLAHNLIEAMAVGTIPILGYRDTLYPALEPGVNCLAYTNESSFADVIEQALALSEAEKATLRAGVIAYYDQYLHPATWAKRLLQAPGDSKRLCFPYESALRGDWARGLMV